MNKIPVRQTYLSLGLGLFFLSGLSNVWCQEHRDAEIALKNGNAKKAIQIWTALAEKGDTEAQYSLGYIYDNGIAKIPADPAKAFKWMSRCEPVDIECTLSLANLYRDGRGTKKDLVRAESLYEKVLTADINKSKYSSTINEARNNLGGLYYRGLIRDKKDQGRELLTTAANAGYNRAQFSLGMFLIDSKYPAEIMDGAKWLLIGLRTTDDRTQKIMFEYAVEQSEKRLTDEEFRGSKALAATWRPTPH